MAFSCRTFQVHCSVQKKPSVSTPFQHLKTAISSASKPLFRGIQQLPLQKDLSKTLKDASVKLLDAFVDSVFEFVDQPLLPSQRNFGPVDELKEAALVTSIEGEIPDDFPEGSNPLYGGFKGTKSVFGRSSSCWIEGEGMVHALYFSRSTDGKWTIAYKNRYVVSETFKQEIQKNKPSFLPALEGDSAAILSAYILNQLRFGKVNKDLSNTNVFEHGGRYYSSSENSVSQEIDIFTLETFADWDLNGAWKRPFTTHPKKAQGIWGELVIFGVDAIKPYAEVGVISADGNELVHKVDLKLNRAVLSHEIGITERYNVFLDCPLSVDMIRVLRGGPLIKFNKEESARIGVMPRYGDADSVQWFNVKPNSTFHLFNCFEDGHEVVVWGCKALASIIPGPDFGKNKFEWFSNRFKPVGSTDERGKAIPEDELVFYRPYVWRLNMQTGAVQERYLTGTKYALDFPMINAAFTGLKNKFGYSQVVDSIASSNSGMAKYGGLAKLYFEEQITDFSSQEEGLVKVEYHMLEENTFCTGSTFVPKQGDVEEDDGWIIAYVHNEDTNISQTLVVDAKNFSGEPVARITLPYRVPYGFHGAFLPIQLQISA